MSFLLAFLLFIRPILTVIGALCVLAILAIGTLFVVEERRGYYRENNKLKVEEKSKAKVRAEKEAAAWEGFFEESFVSGFDSTGAIINKGVRVETEMASAYRKMMDKLTDDQTIELFDSKDI